MQLFPGGTLAVPSGEYPSAMWADNTMRLMRNGIDVIYEACFMFDDVLCAMDILVNEKGKWKAYEVKSSTSISDTYILDAALQSYLIRNSGIKLADISIVYINNQYVRQGEIDVHQFFTSESILENIKQFDDFIPSQIIELKKVIAQNEMPVIDIGLQCSSPYQCDFSGYCWAHVPSPSVFEIKRLTSDKKFDLYSQGIVIFEDIPDDAPLNDAQWMQVTSHLTGEEYFDKAGIAEFVNELNYPLYYLDFETMMPAIPMFDNSRPYQQICTQYSLHVQKNKNGSVEHFEYLGDGKLDPRPDFIKQLVSDLGNSGDIVVYNKSFECTRLKELATDFPDYNESVEAINNRVVDLMLPFQKKMVYKPSMNGSYSIKVVLPALVPELSYKDMEIGDGGTAMVAYESLYYDTDTKRINKIREALLKYCELDTFAMVKIIEKLQLNV